MFVEMILFVFALCTDTFLAGVAYGADHIRISFKKTLLINGICSSCLGVSLLSGNMIDKCISESFTRTICFISLLCIGIFKCIHAFLRSFLSRHMDNEELEFSMSGIRCIVRIYDDPLAADADKSKTLSWKEAVLFALAMSVDSFLFGTLAAFMKISIVLTVFLTFLTGESFLCLGSLLGRIVINHTKYNISWLGGVLFIFLAFWKTFLS